MLNSEYDDSRPVDGQDERERRRAEQEAYDSETIARYISLAHRYVRGDFIDAVIYWGQLRLNMQLKEQLSPLLDKEGF